MLPGLVPIEAVAGACLLDAARVAGLPALLEGLAADSQSLYAGPPAEQLADVAPYIVAADAGSAFNQWFFESAWGQSAGVVVQSEADPDDLRTHFRHFLMVMDESGKSLYFRFYDPRVLRIFLPTCDAEQLAAFFGPVGAFVVEDEDPARALRYTVADGELLTETIDLTAEAPAPRPKIEWKGRR